MVQPWASHTANATEDYCKEQEKGEGSLTPKHLLPGPAQGLLSLECVGAPLLAV